MCGFVVALGKHIDKERLNSALLSIRHRGPDDVGIWQDNAHGISFGHTRLSIIDLKNGVQPITNADQTLVAVVNGEFYGYQEIRSALAADGYRLKTESDSEIILGLYERYGVRALKHLRGEFAFVLWDQKNRLIFAARDYFGVKPLFYTEVDDAIYFASEAKAFKALGLPLGFGEENFFQSLCMFPNPEESLFSGVKQVPPAHYLIRSALSRACKVQSYWDFNYPKETAQSNKPTEDEAAEGLFNVLDEAVRLRLRADVPVACYLSGGLDSCSILGIAQKNSATPIGAFTLTFDHSDYDEGLIAKETAQFTGSPFFPVPITQDDIAQFFEDAVWHAEKFLINGHAVAKFLLSKAVNRAGIKVVLTGEGSDEIFGGYAHFRQDEILYGKRFSEEEKTALLTQLRNANKVSSGLLLTDMLASDERTITSNLGFFPAWMRNFAHLRPHVLNMFQTSTLEKLKQRNPIVYSLNYLDLAGQTEGRDILSRSLYVWSKLILPYYLLTVLGDRMEMAHSVEGRVPFLDHKVVEYVVSLPSEYKIKSLKEKYILRQAAKPYLTKTVYERQKHPFLAPPAFLAEKKNRMSMLIEDTLRGQHLKNLPFIDQKGVINMLDSFEKLSDQEKAGVDVMLLALVSACLLQKRISA